jgi:hypothetical protein
VVWTDDGAKSGPVAQQLLLVCEGFDAGEFFAFEELEAGAATGADVGDLVGYDLVLD